MPDDRPWADTQSQACAECGLDPTTMTRAELPDAVRGLGRRYRIPLTRFLPGEDPDTVAGARSAGGTAWSALEYACHARDVLGIFADRIELTLAEDRPELGWWDHEAAVADDDYAGQDRATVADELAANAERLGAVLATVPDDGWGREATRRGTETFTVEGLGRFALHEGHHHLLDVGRALRTARGR